MLEQRYKKLFENLIDGYAYHEVVYDNKGKAVDYIFLEANSAFETLTGLKVSEIIGKRVTEVIPNIERFWIETYGEIATNCSSISFERYSEPLKRHYLVRAFSYEKGRFAVIFTDVTEIKALKSKNELLSRIVMHATNEFYIFKKDNYSIVYTNYSALANTGYLENELEGVSFLELIIESEREEVKKISSLISSGDIKKFELILTFKRKNNSFYKASVILQFLSEPEELFIANVNDITEKLNIDQELKTLKTAVEQNKDGIALLNLDGGFEYVNIGLEDLLGYNKSEIIKANLNDFEQYEDNVIGIINILKNCIKTKKFWSGNLKLRKKDGSVITTLATLTPILDDNKEVFNVLLIIKDLTDYLQLEEKYLHSQKMEAIGRLAGGIAHDFNNMLTGIMGKAELALMSINEDSDIGRDLKDIIKIVKNSADLTKQLLTFARKQSITPKVLDLNKVIKECLKMVNRVIGENIKIELKLTDKLFKVYMDEIQIQQILVNLILNAKDAIKDSGKIIIETKNVQIPDEQRYMYDEFIQNEYVQLEVSDTGCGMDSETLKRIFEPFFTTKPKGVGTGLGLSTIYGIVKQNNGVIRVYSEPGRGTTFKIYIPKAPLITVESENGVKEIETLNDLKINVLVVEDDELILDILKRIFESFSFKVFIAKSGKEAQEIVNKAEIIDLLIADIVIPDFNGIELYKTLKNKLPDLKVIYMSGYSEVFLKDIEIGDKKVNFIQKPFSVNELISKIKTALNQ